MTKIEKMQKQIEKEYDKLYNLPKYKRNHVVEDSKQNLEYVLSYLNKASHYYKMYIDNKITR